jgi:hypothetical protein
MDLPTEWSVRGLHFSRRCVMGFCRSCYADLIGETSPERAVSMASFPFQQVDPRHLRSPGHSTPEVDK